MSLLDQFDLSQGDLPPWIVKAVAVTRPLTTSGIIAIPVMGAFSVGLISGFESWFVEAGTGARMAKDSTAFLQGIPDAAYAMIATIALGYSASKTAEAIKAPKPAGGASPELPTVPVETPPASDGRPDYAR
ncbi:hypothetical protein ACWPMX_07720 [Tsuneonella sp. HG094]